MTEGHRETDLRKGAGRTPLLARVSIRYIMPLALALPVIAVAIILIWLAYATGRKSAGELAQLNTRQIHQQIEEHLSRLLDMPPAMNELQKNMLGAGELSWRDMDRNRPPVFQLLRVFPDVPSIVLGSAEGQTMWIIRYPGETAYEYAIKPTPEANMDEYALDDAGRPIGERLTSYDWHPQVRPWFVAAVEADGPTWGAVYPWKRGGKPVTLGVSYVEPIHDDAGRLLGVICTEMTLLDISDYLGRLPIGKTGKAFIIERDGNLVATSVGAQTMKLVERGDQQTDVVRLPAAESEDPWIAAAVEQLTRDHGQLAAIEDNVSRDIVIDSTPMQMVVSRFINRQNLDWLIVTLAPDDDFLGGVKRNRDRSLMIGGLAVLATLLLGFFLAMLMMTPFLKLVAHVRRVAQGNLDERIDLHDNREMAELSQEINQMVDDLQDRMKLRHALGLAMEVQQSLLPNGRPDVQGLDIAARSQYCDETGGDYYDYLELAGVDSDSLVIALGDVMGHGVAAAMLMATARGILRSHVRVQGSLSELMGHVNDLLVVDTAGTRFMTMFLGVIDTASRTLRWASAGHDPPFIYDPATRAFLEMEDAGGLPLGVVAGEAYQEMLLPGLKPGMILVVGTDGLWESMNPADEPFGKDRLKDAIRELAGQDAHGIQAGLYDKLTAFCGSRSIDDDVTFVVVKLTDAMFKGDEGADI